MAADGGGPPAGGFAAVRICVGQGEVRRARTLYVKPHTARAGDGQAQRTVFVAGLPFWNHDYEAVLRALFAPLQCPIETIAVHPTQVSALVRFASKAGPVAVMKAAADGRVLEAQLAPLEQHYGLKALVEAHKGCFPGNAILRDQLDNWMTTFEAAEAERRREAAASAEADQGWTVVTRRGGRRKSSDGAGTALGGVAPALAAAQAATRKDQSVADFYRFQQKERHRNELSELRKNFEDDKRRIAQLRAARKFKPY